MRFEFIYIIVLRHFFNTFFQQEQGHTRFRLHSHCLEAPSARIIPYLNQAGFGDVAKIHTTKVDSKLVVALLERWRPETHTFHFPTGESTITLEDVRMLFGLRIDGQAVNGPTQLGRSVYMEHLGIEPPNEDRVKNQVKITWLQEVLAFLKDREAPTEEENILHAKIYILLLISCFLFPNKSQNLMHCCWVQFVGNLETCNNYSWGSACLANLYRCMCKASYKGVKSIGGCVLLMNIWAFWHIPLIAPMSYQVPEYPYATR